jgi:hypothetical protein
VVFTAIGLGAVAGLRHDVPRLAPADRCIVAGDQPDSTTAPMRDKAAGRFAEADGNDRGFVIGASETVEVLSDVDDSGVVKGSIPESGSRIPPPSHRRRMRPSASLRETSLPPQDAPLCASAPSASLRETSLPPQDAPLCTTRVCLKIEQAYTMGARPYRKVICGSRKADYASLRAL